MINWKIRAKNPTFWTNTVISVMIAVLGYVGLTVQDLTSWQIVYDAFIRAVQTPYMWIMAAVIVYNALVDPTTTGITDSAKAMSYDVPNNDKGAKKW